MRKCVRAAPFKPCHSCGFMVGALALVSTLPLVTWLPDVTWHDQQRVGQALAFVLALLAALFSWANGRRPAPLLDRVSGRLVILVIAGAMISACLAEQPLWAFTEVALGVACLGLASMVASMRRSFWRTADRILLATLVFTSAGLAARFVAAYLAAVFGADRIFDAWLLVDGFSNPRFYGQFLTLALPVLAAPLLMQGGLRRYAPLAGLLIVLVWTAAITSGTRGTWLGMGCAAVVLACVGPAGRRWAALQGAAAVTGLGLFWLALTVVPDLLGAAVANHAASRLSTSLSGREIIWTQALDVALSHPLLGIGPMQLATLPNGVAAHPHQALLQWVAELGLPSALLVTWLVLRGARALFPVLRKSGESMREQDVLRLCLAGSVLAALAQSMVDGVLVMPYSQLWLALLAGWLVGLQPRASGDGAAPTANAVSGRSLAVRLAGFAGAVLLLGFVVVRDYPHLAQREDDVAETFGGDFQPRFWAQGTIARKASSAD